MGWVSLFFIFIKGCLIGLVYRLWSGLVQWLPSPSTEGRCLSSANVVLEPWRILERCCSSVFVRTLQKWPLTEVKKCYAFSQRIDELASKSEGKQVKKKKTKQKQRFLPPRPFMWYNRRICYPDLGQSFLFKRSLCKAMNLAKHKCWGGETSRRAQTVPPFVMEQGIQQCLKSAIQERSACKAVVVCFRIPIGT